MHEPDERADALSMDEQRSLRCLVGLMIPASAEYSVPGADDDSILADILASLGRDADLVREGLRQLDTIAGGRFADIDPAGQEAAAEHFRRTGGAAVLAVTRATVQCYYRDDRVMRSLGMEVRPPFPEGFEVERGDWSLLDPVRSRPPFFRHAL
jgi:hypothetical protein